MKAIIILLSFLYIRSIGTPTANVDFSQNGMGNNDSCFSLALIDLFSEKYIEKMLNKNVYITIGIEADSLGIVCNLDFVKVKPLEHAENESEKIKEYLINNQIKFKHCFYDGDYAEKPNVYERFKQQCLQDLRTYFKDKKTRTIPVRFPSMSLFSFYRKHGYFKKSEYLNYLFDETFCKDK